VEVCTSLEDGRSDAELGDVVVCHCVRVKEQRGVQCAQKRVPSYETTP
jgi:hypothetical protein